MHALAVASTTFRIEKHITERQIERVVKVDNIVVVRVSGHSKHAGDNQTKQGQQTHGKVTAKTEAESQIVIKDGMGRRWREAVEDGERFRTGAIKFSPSLPLVT